MQRLPLFAAAAAFAVLLACADAGSALAAAVGKVAEVQGSATLAHAGGAAAAIKAGDAVSADDTVATQENSRVRIVFDDKTEIVVASKGSLKIDSFVYDASKPAASKAQFSIAGAAFSYLGGLIDKGDVNLKVDFGSIGIRGTQIFRAMRRNECWIYVKSGVIDVSNKAGKVHLTEGQGTRMSAMDKAPADAHTWSQNEIDWIVGETANPWTHHKDWK